jgi:fatty-acyl-CoA synthase
MTGGLIIKTPSAYGYPLLIRYLLRTGLAQAPEQEIVYAGHRPLTYPEFGDGWRHGPGQPPLSWIFLHRSDNGRSVVHHHVRLLPEQILHTINHADDDVILVNAEFLAIVEGIWDCVEPGKKLC